MTGRLAGKAALVSGAARGIGADTARLFAGQGACVMLADIRDDEGQAVAAAITADGGSAACCPACGRGAADRSSSSPRPTATRSPCPLAGERQDRERVLREAGIVAFRRGDVWATSFR